MVQATAAKRRRRKKVAWSSDHLVDVIELAYAWGFRNAPPAIGYIRRAIGMRNEDLGAFAVRIGLVRDLHPDDVASLSAHLVPHQLFGTGLMRFKAPHTPGENAWFWTNGRDDVRWLHESIELFPTKAAALRGVVNYSWEAAEVCQIVPGDAPCVVQLRPVGRWTRVPS
jgi:hypothetical protein